MEETPERHPSTERLYQVASVAAGITTPGALAAALEEDAQVITNWGRRGVSVPGALKAQKVFGCDANWLLTGEGAMLAGWPFSVDLLSAVHRLEPEPLRRAENALRGHLDMPLLPAPRSLGLVLKQKEHDIGDELPEAQIERPSPKRHRGKRQA